MRLWRPVYRRDRARTLFRYAVPSGETPNQGAPDLSQFRRSRRTEAIVSGGIRQLAGRDPPPSSRDFTPDCGVFSMPSEALAKEAGRAVLKQRPAGGPFLPESIRFIPIS